MLTLLVTLLVLALIGWGFRAVAIAFKAPDWLLTIIVIIFLLIAITVIANFFGIATPALT